MPPEIHGSFSVRSQEALGRLQQQAATEHKRVVVSTSHGNRSVQFRPERSPIADKLASFFGVKARESRALQAYSASLPTEAHLTAQRFRHEIEGGMSRFQALDARNAPQHTFGESRADGNPHADRIAVLRETLHDRNFLEQRETQQTFRKAAGNLGKLTAEPRSAEDLAAVRQSHDARRAASGSPLISGQEAAGLRGTSRVVDQFGSSLSEAYGKKAAQAWGRLPAQMESIEEESGLVSLSSGREAICGALVDDLLRIADSGQAAPELQNLLRGLAEELTEDPQVDLGRIASTLDNAGLPLGGPGLERFLELSNPQELSRLR